MINKGIFENVVNQVKSVAPGASCCGLQIKSKAFELFLSDSSHWFNRADFRFSFSYRCLNFSLLFMQWKNKFFLYPLAIILHTLMDFIGALFNLQDFKYSSNGLRNHHTPKPESGYEILPHGTFFSVAFVPWNISYFMLLFLHIK